ncbi:MAG: hypothetical protein ACW981_20510 [Candidatus Hodarchaeales archaeon]
MDIFQLIRFVTPFIAIFVMLYIVKQNLSNQRDNTEKEMLLYLTLGLGLFIIGLASYSITPFLTESQVLLAEFALGGSLIFIELGLIFYIEYWHSLYKRIPWISMIFYYATGAMFLLLLSNPWEINYVDDYGYSQNISDTFLVVVGIQFICLIIVIFQSIRNIKESLDNKITIIETISKEKSDIQDTNLISRRKHELARKKNSLDLILISFLIGASIAALGLLPGVVLLESIGALIAFLPQAYILSKDHELLIYLLTQRVKEEKISKIKEKSIMPLESIDSSQIPITEIQSLVSFIEKADQIFFEKKK